MCRFSSVTFFISNNMEMWEAITPDKRLTASGTLLRTLCAPSWCSWRSCDCCLSHASDKQTDEDSLQGPIYWKGKRVWSNNDFPKKKSITTMLLRKENAPQELYKLYFQGLREYERKENRLHMDFLHGLKSGQEGYPPLGHLRTIDSQNLKSTFYNQRKSDRRNSTAWKRDVRSPEASCWGHL